MGALEFLREEKFMMEEMLRESNRKMKREIYDKMDSANITVLYGLRGTGKTTLLAQKYFESENRLAIHGEHLRMSGYGMKDIVSSLKYFFREGHLFIDEITRLEGWADGLKVLSDMYPKVKITITGSSAVDLQDARRTLARRALFINIKPLTFNEFLKIKYGVSLAKFDPFCDDVLSSALKTELDARGKALDVSKVFSEYKYMNMPYLIEKPASTLLDVLERIVYEDIGGSFSEDVLGKFLPLLKFIALSEKASYDSLSRDLCVGKGTLIKMLEYLIKANVIKPIYPYAHGKAKVRREPKYLFVSSAFRLVLLELLGEKERAVGLSREDVFAMHIDGLFYLRDGPDYVWKNSIFEIGGPSKDARQFRNIDFKGRKFIIYEGEEVKSGEVSRIPFYVFLTYF